MNDDSSVFINEEEAMREDDSLIITTRNVSLQFTKRMKKTSNESLYIFNMYMRDWRIINLKAFDKLRNLNTFHKSSQLEQDSLKNESSQI